MGTTQTIGPLEFVRQESQKFSLDHAKARTIPIPPPSRNKCDTLEAS
jgi:hypothetical protein